MQSLESMRTIIRASTTSMTSVPKPLKFLRPHYAKMKEIYEKMADGLAKVILNIFCLNWDNFYFTVVIF